MENVPQSLAELNQLVEKQKQTEITSVTGYLLGSLVFPPLSTIFVLVAAYRKNALHLALPAITILYSILSILNGLLSLTAVKSTALIPGAVSAGSQNNGLQYAMLMLAVVGVGLGYYFRIKGKQESVLSPYAILVLISVLVLQFVVMSFALFSVVGGIYTQLSGITAF